jgi:hypothetical protein
MNDNNEELTQINEEDTEIIELDPSDLERLVSGNKPESNRITVGIHVKKPAQLGPAAYDIAEFVNIIREQTGEPFIIDVQAAVNAQGPAEEKAPIVGFVTEAAGNGDGDDSDDDDWDDGNDRKLTEVITH